MNLRGEINLLTMTKNNLYLTILNWDFCIAAGQYVDGILLDTRMFVLAMWMQPSSHTGNNLKNTAVICRLILFRLLYIRCLH